jgi:hypothetical protein
MRLIGTVIADGTAYAVYCEDEGADLDALRDAVQPIAEGAAVVFGPNVRLVQVSDEPACAVLPTDISASVHDQAGG